ncbi:sporulation protein YqfD [Paenibacillus sp. 481]|uniref:sporulation protein YqfD n=1 Tax=Paenibacillus sp. 481 TaxID=2835869 RepID=UPI001E6571BE|nr:sporulation protein YqfD [Paenibacillus sp. 481]UHA74170.1 sporulation protein YqfD [Paenibacillus sp. 481]
MKAPALARIRGYVQVSVRGEQVESFINAVTKKRITIWDVRTTERGIAFFILLRDYFRLRPLLKKTGCRIHVEQRNGWPFRFKMVWRRQFFFLGALLFLCGLYMLSSLVWSIEVKGNVRIPTETVLHAAKEEGVFPFQWTFRLRESDVLSKSLNARLPDTSWVGIHRQGTKITIQVAETTIPDAKKLVNPRHLVAKEDAVITHVLAEKGRALVRQHMRVKQGNILISGIIESVNGLQSVAAKGEVHGLVWYEYRITSPLISKQKVYTGEQLERLYVTAGEHKVKVKGYGDIPYAQYEIVEDVNKVQWRELDFPVGWVKEKVLEVHVAAEERSVQEAVQAGLQQARLDITAKNGPQVRIHTEKILHQKSDNGKVDLRVLFEVEQSIAVEKPLIAHQ